MSRIKKRPDGRYQLSGTYNGKRKFFIAKTLSAAKKKKYDYEQSLLTPTYDSDMLLSEWSDVWLRHKKADVSAGTIDNYERVINVHIKPALGERPLAELNPPMIRDFITDVRETHAPRTTLRIFAVLKEILTQAVNDDMLEKHPMRGIKTPPSTPSRPWIALTEDDVHKFFNAIESSKHLLMIKIAIATGFRRSEILGLRGADVNFDNATLTVNQTVKRIGGITEISILPKTHKSRRTLTITEELLPLIKEQLKQNKLKSMQDPDWKDNNLLFCNPHGEPYNPESFSRMVREYARAVGMPEGFHLHSLRHTNASLMLAKGANYKVVQERLGHSTSRLTIDTYSHLFPGQDKEAAELFADII